MNVRIRADVRELDPSQVDGIMDGQGYTDIFVPSFSYRKPREGMTSFETRDVSASGLRLEGSFPFKAGSRIAVDLHLPDDRVLVKALVEIMWVEADDRSEGWKRAGARFAALGDQSTERLQELLAVT